MLTKLTIGKQSVEIQIIVDKDNNRFIICLADNKLGGATVSDKRLDIAIDKFIQAYTLYKLLIDIIKQ